MGLMRRAVCDLSGAVEQVELDGEASVDAADFVPDGWVRVVIERPIPNPDLVALELAQQSLLEGQIEAQRQQLRASQVGVPADKALTPEKIEEVLASQRPILAKTAEAYFAGLRAELPARVTMRSEVLIADPDKHPEVAQPVQAMMQALGLAPVEATEGANAEEGA